jgi:hypothetical protein
MQISQYLSMPLYAIRSSIRTSKSICHQVLTPERFHTLSKNPYASGQRFSPVSGHSSRTLVKCLKIWLSVSFLNFKRSDVYIWFTRTCSTHRLNQSYPCSFFFKLSTRPWRRTGGVEVQLFDLGTRWMWLVGFTLRPLYPQRKSPYYPLHRRLGGPRSNTGRGSEEKNYQLPPGIEPYNPDGPARSLVAIPNEPSRLLWHAWERWRMHTELWSKNLNGRDQAGDLDIDGTIILEWMLGKVCGKVLTAFVWLRIWRSGGLLWTRQWTFGFHKINVISWLAGRLLASQEGLCSKEFFLQSFADLSPTLMGFSIYT